MDLLYIFPHLNATLNATSGFFLLLGFYFIRTLQVSRHRACMLTASSEGLIRPIYFTILTSHTILAAVVTPFVLLTLWRGLKGQYDKHKRLARLVYPVWLYVSVTGVIVYLLLYQLYPNR